MKVQKALHLHLELEKKKPKCIGNEYMIFEKYDGWYGYSDNGGPIMSRAGRAIPSCEHLDMGVFTGRMVFEITLTGVKEFHVLNGILNRSVGDYAAPNVELLVHDFIPHNEQSCPFDERYAIAEHVVRSLGKDYISLAPCVAISDSVLEWKRVATGIWSQGAEGVILKRTKAPYSEGKRNYDLMKIKEEVTLDLLVVATCEGEGKYAGTLGTLIVRDKSGKNHKVSGMSDAERDEWFENPMKICTKVVEVRAMKILPDGSLREPRFKAVRHDKTKADID